MIAGNYQITIKDLDDGKDICIFKGDRLEYKIDRPIIATYADKTTPNLMSKSFGEAVGFMQTGPVVYNIVLQDTGSEDRFNKQQQEEILKKEKELEKI